MSKELEHLSCEEILRELVLLSLEKKSHGGIVLMYIIPKGSVQIRLEPGSF